MRVLKNLDSQLTNFDGSLITDVQGKPMTHRKVLTTTLGNLGLGAGQGKQISGDQIIRAYDLGLKIHNAKKDLELDVDQFSFIESTVKDHPAYAAIITGQVLMYLREAQEVKDK